ncbi:MULTISPECIES: YtcA family lipoprotein [unclassified Acetobacter]|uniref:YtcA family lipoprotein n=1 Tax=unclassified Acetobacter TaxID=2628570 RepID=UPI00207B1024|nr:YtcA family lipoprotein [Acetobacter sp. P5B1]
MSKLYHFAAMLRLSIRPFGISSALLLGGCTVQGAPSFSLVGAYFPDWMLCGMIGIAAAVSLRVVFVLTGVDAILSLRLFTYLSLGVITALLTWLIWFGP